MDLQCTVNELCDVAVSEDDKIVYHLLFEQGLVKVLYKEMVYVFQLILFMFLYCKKVQWDFRGQPFNLLTCCRRYHHYILGPSGNSSDVQIIHSDTYLVRALSRNTSIIFRILDTFKSKINDLSKLVINYYHHH